ncbi:hypothetical protein RI367_004599 [Sorochytrium milnesiophthora]
MAPAPAAATTETSITSALVNLSAASSTIQTLLDRSASRASLASSSSSSGVRPLSSHLDSSVDINKSQAPLAAGDAFSKLGASYAGQMEASRPDLDLFRKMNVAVKDKIMRYHWMVQDSVSQLSAVQELENSITSRLGNVEELRRQVDKLDRLTTELEHYVGKLEHLKQAQNASTASSTTSSRGR